MKFKLIIATLLFATFSSGVYASSNVRLGAYKIVVSDKNISTFSGKNLLGTHSLWWGTDVLVDKSSNQVYPSVSSFLQSKGVVRYGGGVNEIDPRVCRGAVSLRPAVVAVTWAGPMVCRFGVEEYLSVVNQTGGDTAWLIANIAGINYNLWSISDMIDSVGEAATNLQSQASNLNRYWELGNELERGKYNWSPTTIAQRASAAGKEIIARDSSAHLILPFIEYDAKNQSVRTVFNQTLLSSMTQSVNGLALHLYYDGPPSGPSVTNRLYAITESDSIYRKVTGKSPEIWITEHARWPIGDGTPNWSNNWYKTNNLSGIISVADFLIGIAQISDVAGAMYHGLRAGPWNVFDIKNGVPILTGIGRLFNLLKSVTTDVRLDTSTFSLNTSEYLGGYDMRATAFYSTDRKLLSLWISNRASSDVTTDISFPNLFKLSYQKGETLTCTTSSENCQGDEFKISNLSANNVTILQARAKIVLPAESVTVLQFTF